jgi:hypothetical protein
MVPFLRRFESRSTTGTPALQWVVHRAPGIEVGHGTERTVDFALSSVSEPIDERRRKDRKAQQDQPASTVKTAAVA